MSEIWKTVPGYEGAYEVSSMGRVCSLARRVRHVAGSGTESTRGVPVRLLRPGRAKSGHLSVSLGRKNTKQVHALVLRAFVGPVPEGLECLHKDHDPSNNCLSNLRYGTRSENLIMDYENGSRAHFKKRV